MVVIWIYFVVFEVQYRSITIFVFDVSLMGYYIYILFILYLDVQ